MTIVTPSLFLSELFNLPISHTVGQEGSSASAQTLSDKGHPHIFKYFLCYKYAIPLLISHFLVHGALLGGVSKNTQSILDVSSPGNGLSSGQGKCLEYNLSSFQDHWKVYEDREKIY